MVTTQTCLHIQIHIQEYTEKIIKKKKKNFKFVFFINSIFSFAENFGIQNMPKLCE